MKLKLYVGIEDAVMVIEKPTDLYPALDYIQSKMIELSEARFRTEDEVRDLEECADFISILMQKAEGSQYGSHDDVEAIEY